MRKVRMGKLYNTSKANLGKELETFKKLATFWKRENQ